MSNAKVIFSPHCDDAFLSLGGWILEWKKDDEPILIVNCFSKSGFTTKVSVDRIGSKLVWLISYTRSLEELVNCESVGAKVEFLELPEAPLRGHREPWTTGEHRGLNVFKTQVDDSWLIETLTKIILKFCRGSQCYFPLGIGKHLDHVLLNVAAHKVIQEKEITDYAFYEDQPYAAKHEAGQRFDEVETLHSILQPIDWEKKERLLSTYKSQFEGRYGLNMIKKIETYCDSMGGCERIWLPDHIQKI